MATTVTLQSGQTAVVGFVTTPTSYTLEVSSGLQGSQGPQGIAGATGAQGLQGAQGSTGPQGPTGTTGSAGPQGAQGATGPQGLQGAIGAQGTQGAQGTTGPQGAQGAIGAQGIQGAQGATGAQGNQGDIGPQGPQGDLGTTGPQGVSVTAANVATGNLIITLSNTTTLDAGLVVSSNLSANKIQETFVSLSNANGTFTHDCSNTQVFNHTSIAGNFTANFTNLNLANNYATSLTLILNQGATPYVANAVQIGGAGQTVNWQGNTAAPIGNANKKDIMSFSIINNSGTYIVFGQLTSFG